MRKRYLPNIFDDLNTFYSVFNGCCTEQECRKGTCEGLSVSEDEQKLYIDAPLAGVKPEEVEVTVDPQKRSLLIRGKAKEEREEAHYHLRGAREYAYEIPLSSEIDMDSKVDAVSKDGILSITLAKNRGHKPLKVDVRCC